jgi:hypothetical protein
MLRNKPKSPHQPKFISWTLSFFENPLQLLPRTRAIGCRLRLAEYAEIPQKIRIQLMNLE